MTAMKELVHRPMMLVALVIASATIVKSASFGGIAGLSKELSFNSIPGGDNEESNLVEPAPFSSLSDFLSSKQGLGKKSDDAGRMKALVSALYAMDALDKRMGDKPDDLQVDDGVEELAEVTSMPKIESTVAATTPTPTRAPTTTPTPTTSTTTTTAAATTEADPTEAPTLIHDAEVNEFVDQIAKHISTFFQGLLHYFDGPGIPANATVVIELEEKSDSENSSGSESDSKEDDEVSTEEVPKWLVQMFESVASLPREDADQEKGSEFRPKEPLEAEE